MQRFWFLIPLSFLIASCAAPTYHIGIGARYDQLSDTIFNGFETTEVHGSGSITYLESNEINSPGTGGEISLIETGDWTWAKAGYFYSVHNDFSFRFNSPSIGGEAFENVSLTTHGAELAAGFNLWWFKPYLSVNYIKLEYEYNNPELDRFFSENTQTSLGAGLAIVFAVGETTNIVLDGRYRLGYTVASLSIAFGGWTLGSENNRSR